MQLATDRVTLRPLHKNDYIFILELVNSDGWFRFIGNRHIYNEEDAKAYIQKILDTNNLNYWVVHDSSQGMPLGIISFLKRDYLDHFDIGFAFLPQCKNKGYAFEATQAILAAVTADPQHATVLATTLPDNTRSIRLLEKLGFHFRNDIQVNGQTMMVFVYNTMSTGA
jgi:RimJ/RimL family protein N-acetyltransferase